MRGQNILKSHPLTLNFLTDNIKPIILVFANEILLKKVPEFNLFITQITKMLKKLQSLTFSPNNGLKIY